MKITKSLSLAITLAVAFSACKKDKLVKQEADAPGDNNLRAAIACPSPPTVMGIRTTGGIMNDMAGRVEISNTGVISIYGYYQETVDFDPGPGVFNLTSPGTDYIYLQKFGPQGNFISASNQTAYSNDLLFAKDSQGNQFRVGAERNEGGDSESEWKLMITKISPAQSVLWKIYAGYTTIDGYASLQTKCVAVDKNDNIYVANPSGTLYKYNSAGQVLDSLEYNDVNARIKLDAAGNIYLFGRNSGILQKRSPSGSLLWKVQNEPLNKHAPYRTNLAVDAAGNVYSVGQILEISDLDPGTGVFIAAISGPSSSDMFIQKLNSSGQFVWALTTKGFSSASRTEVRPLGVTLDPTGEYIIVVGGFTGRVNFNGAGTPVLGTSKAYLDAFMMAIRQCK